MAPIDEALEYLELREPGEKFTYKDVVKIFSVSATTLSRRHKGSQGSRETKTLNERVLYLQQEQALIQNI
jgi:hypothetical protein